MSGLPAPEIGDRVSGRYRITRRIGSGGFGLVFAGTDTALDRQVAIKLVAASGARRRDTTDRLLREARIMARLDHPGVVRLYDQGADPRFGSFLVMELLDGEDLAAHLHRRGRLPPELALAILEQVCGALAAAHDAGVLHRDLKPSNIFVLRHAPPQVPVVKLLDFGAAARTGGRGARRDESRLWGTLAYMAPERWQSADHPGVAADIYGMGTILFQMLTGSQPFSAPTRAGLRLAIQNDTPPLQLLPARTPAIVRATIARSLDKRPERRPPNVREFAQLLGLRVDLGTKRTVGDDAGSSGFRGTSRYLVIRKLGQGDHSELFVAHDAESDRRVALRRFPRPNRETAARIKHAYRTAAAVRHPALARVEALHAEAEDLLLVTELAEGRPLLDHVHGDEGRLRSCLAQVAEAVAALHARGASHGALVAANVVVESSGRVVLGDYQGAARFDDDAGNRPRHDRAPSEAERRRAQDLRGLGLILHQALGGPPNEAPFAPGSIALPPAAPSGLAALCQTLVEGTDGAALLATDVAATLRRTGAATVEASDVDFGPPPADAAIFVGRHEALATLVETVGRVEKGRPGLILIEGPSGIGKSALLEELHRRLDRAGNVLTLAGRALERESVPFPALDDAINQLAGYLFRLPPALAELLVPRRCGPLGHLFPVLGELPPIKRAPELTASEAEPAESRRLASDGFRELLRRVGDRQPVVLLLDDIQWLDPDSAALLERTFAGPEPPALLLIGTLRASDGNPRRELQRLVAGLPRETVTRIHLDVLSEKDACEMARARWTGPSPLAVRAAKRMARLSRGVPFLIEMLATDPGKLTEAQPPSLEDVLIARRDALPPRSRRALELLCISSRPIRLTTLLEAVEAPGDVQVIDPLLRATLARYTRLDSEWALEPHHARIREAIRHALHATTRQAHHRRLASLLTASGSGGDVEATIEHLAGCGQTRAAAELARRAAESANEQLAFDRAAALYEIVLKHGRPGGRERMAILQLQARALGHAGRRREAGATLLRAAKSTRDAATASALRRAAGTHLLASGDVATALDVLRPALERLDVKLPSDLAESAAATGAALQALAVRGLGITIRDSPPDGEALDRVDLLLELALGLAHVDLRALPFACQALAAALDVGESQRLQRACALFVINTVEYVPTPLVAPVLELCRELTDATADAAARALLDAAFAENAHFEGDFLTAEAAFERAERTLLESGASASRELATVRDLAVFVQYAHKGDFRTQLARTQHWLDQAEAAQDAFHAGMLRVAHAIVWIAHDDPARARSDLRRAQTESIGTAGVLEVAVALYYDIIDRYEGDEAALATSGDARSALLRSPAAQTPFLSGYLGLHAAWRKLRALGAGTAGADEEDAVCDIIARLRAPRMGIWSAVADALEGNLLFLRGGREAALRTMAQSEQTFRRLHMLCLAACVRKRRGQFVGGELGARLEAEAGSELSTLGVVDIERWTAAYWSMFDARVVAERTRDDLRADASTTWSGPTEELLAGAGNTPGAEPDGAAAKAQLPRRARRTDRR